MPTTIDVAHDPDPHVRGAVAIAEALYEAGYTVYFAGGCVRDWLLGEHPKDVDVVTSATPAEIRKVFPKARDVGEAFGVMLVRPKGFRGHSYEIATFRSDGSYSDGRRPDEVILHSSPEEDAARRDFTINGMFLNPHSGEIVDFVGGQADLEARVIRAIGEPQRRFGEDHLRLLRAIRFAAQTGFEIEPDTWKWMQELAPRIAGIAMERVLHEITRFLVGPRPDHGYRLLADSGLLAVVVPEAAEVDHGVAMLAQLRADGEVAPVPDEDAADNEPWRHMPGGAHWPTAALAWSCVLHAVPANRVAGIVERLKMSNDDRARIADLIRECEALDGLRDLPLPALKRRLRRPGVDELIAHYRLRHLASAEAQEVVDFALDRLRAYTDCEPGDSLRPPLLIDGNDLQTFGYTPGPRFRVILTELEDAQMAGDIRTREQAEEWLRTAHPIES